MIRVKEFLNYGICQEQKVNQWLKENPAVEIIDIKYSVAVLKWTSIPINLVVV